MYHRQDIQLEMGDRSRQSEDAGYGREARARRFLRDRRRPLFFARLRGDYY